MGSTRVVFQKQGDSVYIVQAIQYSPTGVLLSELGSEPTLLTHLFQGKEWIDGFGYDFITRTYDPYTLRMLQIDGADQFASGYTAMGNNPVNGIDPDGQWVQYAIGAAIGGGANLWSNWSKIKGTGWKGFAHGASYFISGAVGGAVGVNNPAAGGAATAYLNVGIDTFTGNVPSFKNFGEGVKYAGLEVAKGFVSGYVGGKAGKYLGSKISKFFSEDAITSSLGTITRTGTIAGEATFDMAELIVRPASRTAASSIGGSVLKQSANFADDFSQIPSKGFIDPTTIRFSQNSIAKNFKSGGSVEEFANGLKSGEILPESIDPIRLVSKDGMTFTLDNRRLWAFQEAGLDIPFVKMNSLPKNQLFKFRSINNGINILIRR